jgi:hypothetical protein
MAHTGDHVARQRARWIADSMPFSRLVLLANALRYSCGRLQVFFARLTEMIGMWAARRPRCASSSVPCAGADRYRLSLSIRPEPGNFSHGNLAAWRSGADLRQGYRQMHANNKVHKLRRTGQAGRQEEITSAAREFRQSAAATARPTRTPPRSAEALRRSALRRRPLQLATAARDHLRPINCT